MAMMVMMGVGLLMNTIQSLTQGGGGGDLAAQMRANNEAMMKSLKNTAGFGAHKSAEVQSMWDFNFETPPFPDKAYKNVQQMQLGNLQERMEFGAQLQREVGDMKNAFFADNHYQTGVGPDGKPQVLTNAQGQPQVAQGPETPDQKLARLQFDSDRKTALADEHANQREAFMSTERDQTKEFLTANREQLGNPYVQGELQKMVVDTRKKSLQLQQNQEDERWKVDAPPVPEIGAHIDNGLAKMRQMDQEHIAQEQSSPDMQELLDHEQKVAAIMGRERDLAQQNKPDEDFLKDPRKLMQAQQTAAAPTDPGNILPSYLTHALYDMGIYQV